MLPAGLDICVNRAPEEAEVRKLIRVVWGGEAAVDLTAVLARSLAHLWAYDNGRLIGFVNVAWDGGAHASIFDTCVHPSWRHRGVGSALVRAAVEAAREGGATYLHVDYEPHLEASTPAAAFARPRPA